MERQSLPSFTGAELRQEILDAAAKHDGRYLLPKRFAPRYWTDWTKTDWLWDACERLVFEGEAKWLDRGSCFYPGITIVDRR